MNTAILPDGVSYYIPEADLAFFKELAAKMKWGIVDKEGKKQEASSVSWVNEFADKWKDKRSTSQIISDIHAARTSNTEIPPKRKNDPVGFHPFCEVKQFSGIRRMG